MMKNNAVALTGAAIVGQQAPPNMTTRLYCRKGEKWSMTIWQMARLLSRFIRQDPAQCRTSRLQREQVTEKNLAVK